MKNRNRRLFKNVVTAFLVLSFAVSSFATSKADDSFVGVWSATLPNGLRVATITVVQNGDSVTGTFVGYDYDRRIDPTKPIEGDKPKIVRRTTALFTDLSVKGNALTFKIQPKIAPKPDKEMPSFEMNGEIIIVSEGNADLKLQVAGKDKPMILKLTRE